MKAVCIHNGTLLNGSTGFENAAIIIQNGKILDICYETRLPSKSLHADTVSIDVQGSFIAPGFIDTHIHGIAGFGTDILSDDNPRTILDMATILPKYGVTSFCPTLYPQPLAEMKKKIALIVQNILTQRNLPNHNKGAYIAGIHLEGPFISPEQLGVHKKEDICTPDIKVLEELIEVGKGYITNMTIAPELKNIHEIAILATRNNIVLQAGHTNAKYKNILEGLQVGILHSTHFFNAMSALHHRNLGTVGAILTHPEISCEIIADGHHVHPDIIDLLLKNKSYEKIVLITDSITPNTLKDEHCIANGRAVRFVDGYFRTIDTETIAGSALTMIQGVSNLVQWNVPLYHTIAMATKNPASIINIPHKGILLPGLDADVCIFNNSFEITHTFIGGDLVYSA